MKKYKKIIALAVLCLLAFVAYTGVSMVSTAKKVFSPIQIGEAKTTVHWPEDSAETKTISKAPAKESPTPPLREVKAIKETIVQQPIYIENQHLSREVDKLTDRVEQLENTVDSVPTYESETPEQVTEDKPSYAQTETNDSYFVYEKPPLWDSSTFGKYVSNGSDAKKICIFNIAGESGPAFTHMKDFEIEAVKLGVQVDLEVYTNEKIAAEDFKAGKCAGVMMTGLRARSFVPFTGSLDSVGALTSKKEMYTALRALSSPKNAAKMTKGNIEVAGIIPIGSVYLFVKDKNMNTIVKVAGKKIAVLDSDYSQAKMVTRIGATPVPIDITSIGSKFNNGAVDVVAVPAIAYEAFELYKGLGDQGGVVNYPFMQLTHQFLINADAFPAGFGQKSRETMLSYFDEAMSMAKEEEAKIDKKFWIEIPKSDKLEYEALMAEMRVWMRDEGYYHPETLTLMRKIRCRTDPTRTECANPKE